MIRTVRPRGNLILYDGTDHFHSDPNKTKKHKKLANSFLVANGNNFENTANALDGDRINIGQSPNSTDRMHREVDKMVKNRGAKYDNVHIIDHGNTVTDKDGNKLGVFPEFGDETIMGEDKVNDFIAMLKDSVGEDGTIYLHGCSQGKNAELCQKIADETGATVKSSSEPVAHIFQDETGPWANWDKCYEPSKDKD